MSNNIREQAARAAREWREAVHISGKLIPDSMDSYITGYLAGYEAGQEAEVAARAREPRWRDHGNG